MTEYYTGLDSRAESGYAERSEAGPSKDTPMSTVNPYIVTINNNRFIPFGTRSEAVEYANAMSRGGSRDVSVYVLEMKVN